LLGSAEEILLRASLVIEDMIIEILHSDKHPVPQSGEPVHFTRRKPEESDWSPATTLDEVYDHIRMLDAPDYPHAFVRVGPFRLEFRRASRHYDSVQADVRITKLDE
jgi:methionyl-tRNA formyltransferase